jgi:hypothetical protein
MPTSSPQELTHLRNQMANILHALSSTFTSCACGACARDCTLTQMAACVESQHDKHQTYATSGRIRKGKDIDLGHLVGRMRGFRTQESVPMRGRLGGMEMDEVPIVRVESLSPQKWNGTFKEGAADGGVEMFDKGRRDRSRNGLSFFSFHFILPFTIIFLGPKSPLNTNYVHPSPASPPHPTRTLPTAELSSELRPPDPTVSEDETSPKLGEDRMPPKLRKRWMHRLRR